MPKRKVEKQHITESDFLGILHKASQPVKSVSEKTETSPGDHPDGCSETHTRSRKTEGTQD
jgi:hypothetical protein